MMSVVTRSQPSSPRNIMRATQHTTDNTQALIFSTEIQIINEKKCLFNCQFRNHFDLYVIDIDMAFIKHLFLQNFGIK